MSPGQELAVEQLVAIEEADSTVFEIIRTTPPSKDSPLLTVVVSLNCRGLERVAEGLPLREREQFAIVIPSDFPFSIPHAWSMHERFAGKPHVQWKRHLCIYQSPQSEWDSSDGMFGFIDRLWIWLEHGAKNLAEPVGLPIHPPVTYRGKSQYIIVPCANTPEIGGVPWFGFASIKAINEQAFGLVNWQPTLHPEDPVVPVAAAILLPTNLSWEMPTKLEGLCKELEASGVKRNLLLALVQWTMLLNPKEFPVFVVVGSPQRGMQSPGQLKQHLTAWQVSGFVFDFLNLSADWIRLQFRLDGIDTPEGDALRLETKAHRAKVERLAMESIELVDVNWCNVVEDRPEIITRRDERSPLGVFRGRHICIWGCGALGSHVAYYLVKAGVKKLTMVDGGTVKPGLLVRQMFEDTEIGQGKALALKRRLEKMVPGVDIEAIHKNVFCGSTINDRRIGADVIIDCTASDMVHAKSELHWPLDMEQSPPIISMIVGPRAERGIAIITRSDSTGAVKDAFRKAKLVACTRPELSAFVRDFYPTGAIEIFQPEPGCSDPTFEGSCADVAGLAALLLNAGANLLKGNKSTRAACFVCQPHLVQRKSGQVAYAEFSFERDIVCQNDYQIRFSLAAWKEMAAAIRQGRRKGRAKYETGGLLFGKRDDAVSVIWVDDAIGPPPDSICSPDKFICGINGTQEATKIRKERSRGSTEFIGMWHTHPQDVPLPSTTDLSGMEQILTSGEAPPLKSLLVIVGWERDEILLGTSVFNRGLFRRGDGVVAVTINHFPELKI